MGDVFIFRYLASFDKEVKHFDENILNLLHGDFIVLNFVLVAKRLIEKISL